MSTTPLIYANCQRPECTTSRTPCTIKCTVVLANFPGLTFACEKNHVCKLRVDSKKGYVPSRRGNRINSIRFYDRVPEYGSIFTIFGSVFKYWIIEILEISFQL